MEVDTKLSEILTRGVSEIISYDDLVKLLGTGKPLRLKMGFDPSRPDIHLGHVVGLRKLRQFQELGHSVVLIVGDWTAQIGDPSGASITRPMLTAGEVRENAQTYLSQFFSVVDRDRTEVRWQSEWFGHFDLGQVIWLTSKFTVAQLLAREDFNQRFKANKPLAVTELLYPLLQAYDSVAVESDVEFGGSDQKFNLLMGRELQDIVGQRPQQCLLMPILPGTDGVRKMSKSLDNYIAVDDLPTNMYGKVMSIPDELIQIYFELLSDRPKRDLDEMVRQMSGQLANPMRFKKLLAHDLTSTFHGKGAANEAREAFERVYQRGQSPISTLRVRVPFSKGALTVEESIFRIVVPQLVQSKAEVKRLLGQGAIKVDGKKITSPELTVRNGTVVTVGKHGFIEIVLSEEQRNS